MQSPRLYFLPWLVLVASLCITWLSWEHEHQIAEKALRAQFDFALRNSVSQIEQRVAAYEQTLRGVQALFATTNLTNRDAVRNYVQTLQLDANFSGIQIIGVIQQILPEEKDAHIATMRRLGFAQYRIHPEGNRDVFTAIIQREPSLGLSHAPLGLDPWADPVRRRAMEKARDSGLPALTGKVQLAIDQGAKDRPGFVMYLPIFERGKPRDTLDQRRSHLVGWVYASFRMNEFMASLYGKQDPQLILEIYDEANPIGSALMYRSGNATESAGLADSPLWASEYMVIAGHTWTLLLRAGDEFRSHFGRSVAEVIAVTGMGLSVLISLLVWFMVSGRARALQLAAKMTEELRQMAQHDPLTGLPNRALFSDRVQYQLAYAKRHGGHFAMIFLDLDNFKPINDNHGHAMGDQVLQEVARRLREAIRATDTVGRIGGDEFVVLLPGLPSPQASIRLAEKIRQAVRAPYYIDGIQLGLSCSIGVAVYPEDGTDEISLTKAADEAMYRAKDHGRDGIQVASDLRVTTLDH